MADMFVHIARRLHGEEGVHATLESILALTREVIGADRCGVMLVHRGQHVETVAATDEIVIEADHLQVECGAGPCLDAVAQQATMTIADTSVEPRWPTWCRRVEVLGIRSVLAVRLFTNQATLGSLNIYSGQIGRYDSEAAELGSIFGGHASVALATARTEAGLREAMERRHQIGVAQGIPHGALRTR